MSLPKNYLPPSSEIPALEIKQTPGVPLKHEICGWEELFHWANCNHALWRAVMDRTAHIRMSEVETLKVLSAELLRQNVDANKRLCDMAGQRCFFPNVKPE